MMPVINSTCQSMEEPVTQHSDIISHVLFYLTLSYVCDYFIQQ